MRTRSSAAAASKKTPPAKKPTAVAESDTPKTRRGKGKQPKNTQQSSVEGADVEQVEQEAKVEVTPPVKSAGKRTAGKSKTPASRKGTRRSSRLSEADEVDVEEASQKANIVESKDGRTRTEEGVVQNAGEVEEEAMVVVDQGVENCVRVEGSVDDKVSESVERPSCDDTKEGLGKEKSAGSSVDMVTKEQISNDVEESEKKQKTAMVLGVCMTANAGLSLKQEPDKEGDVREMELAPPVNAEVSLKQREEPDKKEETAAVMELPSITSADVLFKKQEEPDKKEKVAAAMELPLSNDEVLLKQQEPDLVMEVPPISNAEVLLKQQEEPDKKEEAATAMEVSPISNAGVLSKQQEELDKKEEAATAMEVPPISNAEVLLKQQEEPDKKEEAATAMEVPPISNAEVLFKQQEEPDMVMEVAPISNAEVLLKQQEGPCKKDETAIVMEALPVVNAEVFLKQKEETDKNEETAMQLDVPPVVHADEEPDEKKRVAAMEKEVSSFGNADASLKEGEAREDVSLNEGKTPEEVFISAKSEESRAVNDGEEVKGKQIEGVTEIDKKEPVSVTVDVAESLKSERQIDPHKYEKQNFDDEMEEHGDEVNLEQHEEDHPEEPIEETETLEDENRELTAAMKDRIMKKECEIFVGGLERDATEGDLRKVFERIGEVLEVRLHKNLSTNKNKGYAFVRFANKDLTKRALEEMKNPVICGKQCGTAPCEDNNTLFLGNICNTWTKEAIRQKLKEYGVEAVESINLVQDVQHDGLSRGFAFLEFSSHADALLAYRRLQKPDVVFGHPERTAKVAFAEPLREPDPEVMAQVKTVFLDGLPLHWDEDRIREQLKGYGEILRVVLARNMSNAKRKDYGFVDFSTHDAAVACINGVNNTDFGDGNKRTKVKARLSNPLPKTQAVKGGICGGYLIGRGSGSASKSGRNYGRGMPHFHRVSIQRGRGFHQGGRGQFGRASFPAANEYNNPYDFHGRQMLGRGGRRGSYRGGRATGIDASIATSARPSLVRPWHAAPDIGRGRHIPPPRQPYISEVGFGRPFDDPYPYNDNARGMKRPLYMTDVRPDYMEPSSVRPRIDYSDPAAPPYGNRYPDSAGPSGSFYPCDYGSSYRGGPRGGAGRGRHPSYFGGARPYNGGYY